MKSHPQLVLVIKKDWDINLDDNLSLEELHHRLAGYINQLMVNDFSRLLNLLYRIDVNEEKLKTSLKEFYDKDAADVIATLVIERQLQKILLWSQVQFLKMLHRRGQVIFGVRLKLIPIHRSLGYTLTQWKHHLGLI